MQRLGLIAVTVVVAGAAVAAVSLAERRPTGSMPEVTAVSAPCPAAPSPVGGPGSPLVPERRYQRVQLCATSGEMAPLRTLDEQESADLVRRLNALPPGPPCDSPATELRLDVSPTGTVVVRLHREPCDVVTRDGVTRAGAGELRRWVTELIGDGVPGR